MLFLISFFTILFLPSVAEAWGPLTHVYLAHQVINLGTAVIPAGIYGILKKYKSDFIYGNLSADIILGKRFQSLRKNSHSWEIAWKLFRSAETDQQKAFAYGYLTHLCADTVAHNLTLPALPFQHPIVEIRSESLIDKKYRNMIKRLDKPMQKRHDVLLENLLESVFFSFKTNKKIFRGFLVLSRLPNYTTVSNFIDRRFPVEIQVQDIYHFQEESLNRMLELLQNGKKSDVLNERPFRMYYNRVKGRRQHFRN
jgi:hypothetical protein